MAPTKDDTYTRMASNGLMIGLWSNPQYQCVAWSSLDSQVDNPHSTLVRFFTERETCEILEVWPTGGHSHDVNQRCAYWRKQLGVE